MQYYDNIDAAGGNCHSAKLIRMQSRLCSSSGFTLVELMVVIALIGALLSIAAPQLVTYLEQGRKAKCLSNRYNIEQDERTYYLNNNSPSLAIDSRYQCASGGTYAWLVSDPTAPDYPRIGCSLHYGQLNLPLTSLGSTFAEITTSMIDLINKFYQQNNRYPRSWGEYVFTDIGLDPSEWAQPVNGLYYSAGGTRVTIQPAEGYTLTMKSTEGATLTLTPKLKWDLLYDVSDKQWYYHRKDPGNAVDISTLQIIKK
jgi:prepilin-type N-terminal cleavage/methylation domain-containing protein